MPTDDLRVQNCIKENKIEPPSADIGDGTNETQVSGTGDITFAGSAGLLFGAIYGYNVNDSLVMAAQDTWYQVVSCNANGHSNGTTPDHTNDHITILTAGKYLVWIAICAHASVSTDYEFSVFKNNGDTQFENVTGHRTTSVANAIGAVSMQGICDFAVNDTVELWSQRLSGGAASKTIVFDHVSLIVLHIGG
jgi:hypothetical protein